MTIFEAPNDGPRRAWHQSAVCHRASRRDCRYAEIFDATLVQQCVVDTPLAAICPRCYSVTVLP